MNFHYIKEYIKGLTLGASLITSLSLSESQAHTFQTNLYPDIELKEDKLVIELWIASFLFPPLQHINYGDADAGFRDGIWLGIVRRSGEAIVGNAHGVYKSS